MKPQQLYSIAPLSIHLAQQEQKHWANYNFPKSTQLHVPALGVAEECGELYTELIKVSDSEIWVEIPGYEGIYTISNIGRVKRIKGGQGAIPGHILSTSPNKDGYLGVHLYNGSVENKKWFAVHQLVAMSFIGPVPDGYEVNHKDGVKTNNFPHNLEYVTHQDNIKYSISLDHPYGFRGVDLNTLDEIRYLIGNNVSNKEIAEKFNIDPSTVSRIRTGDSYSISKEPINTGPLLKASGELCHAVLKMEQSIRGDQMPDLQDAIGDICIYLMDLCNKIGVDFETCILNTWAEVRERDWVTYPVNGKTK